MAGDFTHAETVNVYDMNDIEYLFTPDAPKPGGHYSQAVRHNGCIYVAGQLPIDPISGKPVAGEIEAQAELVLRNLQAILRGAGSDLSRLLKVTVYISNIELWARFNAVYVRMMGDAKPARAVVPVNDLHYGCLVEIEAIAAA